MFPLEKRDVYTLLLWLSQEFSQTPRRIGAVTRVSRCVLHQLEAVRRYQDNPHWE